MSSYKVSAYPAQKTLVDRLRATGVPVVVLAVNDPYDVAYLGDARPTSRRTPTARRADRGRRVVVGGEVAPAGGCLVVVPVAGDPTQDAVPPSGTACTTDPPRHPSLASVPAKVPT